jgi:Tfp pilus assembly protein PilN
MLAATAVVLGVIFLGNQAFENQQRLDDLTAQSELLKQEAISLRKEIEGRQATLDIANKRAQFIYNRHKLSTVLRDITIALPDHTWVSNVNYSKTNVSIIGATSESSADLVLQLAKVNRIQNPQLIGSVSKNQSGSEKFELRYSLEAFK